MAPNPPNPGDISRSLARALRRLYPRKSIQTITAVANPSYRPRIDLSQFKHDCAGFAKTVLGVSLTSDQIAIVSLLPGRVKINSGHGVGKSYLAAVVTVWWFCTRNPGIVITTAPTERAVVDILWTEIRILISHSKYPLPIKFIGPRAPELFDHDEHWAKGYTANSGEAFQGRHRPSMLFIFDEAEGIDSIYWQTTETMYQPDSDHAWLALGNPITTSTQSYLEDMLVGSDGKPKWQLFSLSALNHPNIVAQLAGKPPPYPNAVTMGQVDQWVRDLCDIVKPGDKLPGDIEWHPGSGKWYRPGPQFLARVLGQRPTSGVDTVWSMTAWAMAINPHDEHGKLRHDPVELWLASVGITIGADIASYGDDSTVIHIRMGPLSLHHESHNGWLSARIAQRIRELCIEWTAWYNKLAVTARPPMTPADVTVLVELDGYGVQVLERCDGFGNWGGIKVAEASERMDQLGKQMYFNKRSDIWFTTERRAREGRVNLSRLPRDVLERLRLQILTPSYAVQNNGTMIVESKKDVKKRLKRSPDDADGMLVCYSEVSTWKPTVLTPEDRP